MKKISNSSAELFITDDIDKYYGVSADNVRQMLADAGNAEELTIHISSYGGDVFQGNDIFNLLVEHPSLKTGVIGAVAASMASLIAMACDELAMHKNSFLMIHNPWTFTGGESKDLRNTADLLDKIKANAVAMYKRKAKNLSDEKISELMDNETWMTAEEALAYGFIDRIIDSEELEEPKTSGNMKLPDEYKKMLMKIKPVSGSTPQSRGDTMKKCPHCGVEHVDTAKFCSTCGKDVTMSAQQLDIKAIADKAAAIERSRVIAITNICSASHIDAESIAVFVASGKSVEELSFDFSEKIKAKAPAASVPHSAGSAFVSKDESDKFRAHAVNCLSVVSNLDNTPQAKAAMVGGEQIGSLHGLMARVLQKAGVDPIGLAPHELVNKAFSMSGTSSSDLPYILENVANKSLLKGYEEAPVSFRQWTGTMQVKDFKQASLVKMSNFGDIEDIPEGAEFKNGKFSDKKETVSIDTKGKKFTVTRNAMINDDLSALTVIPMKMTSAVARRMNKDVYDRLTFNSLVGPVMNEDSKAVFHLDHSNLIANSGVISVTSLDAADQKLLNMPLPKSEPDADTQYSGISGRYIITGTLNRLTALQVLNSGVDISKSINNVYNPFTGLIPIFDPYLQSILTANSKSYAWYLAADYNQMDTISVAYLQGNTTPTLRSSVSGVGDPLGMSWDIYFDWGIAIPDFRGLVYNDGATGG
jgi:ATP-dependent protease ClpP protease subunit